MGIVELPADCCKFKEDNIFKISWVALDTQYILVNCSLCSKPSALMPSGKTSHIVTKAHLQTYWGFLFIWALLFQGSQSARTGSALQIAQQDRKRSVQLWHTKSRRCLHNIVSWRLPKTWREETNQQGHLCLPWPGHLPWTPQGVWGLESLGLELHIYWALKGRHQVLLVCIIHFHRYTIILYSTFFSLMS